MVVGGTAGREDPEMFEIAARVINARGDISWVRKSFRTEAARDRWIERNDGNVIEVRYADAEA